MPSTRTRSACRSRPATASSDGVVAGRSVEVDEERVVTESLLARARLDAGQVDPAEGELRQAAHEPARGLVAGPPEHERRRPALALVALGAVAGARDRVARGQPDEARLVAGHVLDALGEDRRAVALGRRPRPDRRVGAGALGDEADRLGRRADGHDLRLGQAIAQEAHALLGGVRMRGDEADVGERPVLGGDQAVDDGQDDLADERDVLGVDDQRVEGRRDRPGQRVLERDQAAVELAALHAHDDLVDRRAGDELVTLGVDGAARRLVGERARRSEVADAHGPGAQAPVAPPSATRIASASSGESSCSAWPFSTCLV